MDADKNKTRRLREFWVMRRQLDIIQESLNYLSPEKQAEHYRPVKKAISETLKRSMDKISKLDYIDPKDYTI